MKSIYCMFILCSMALCSCVNKEVHHSFQNDHDMEEDFKRLQEVEVESQESSVALIAKPSEKPIKEESSPQENLTLTELLKSTETKFPLILAALETVEIARGEALAAEGGFDLYLKSKVGTVPEGYYQNETTSVKLEQAVPAFGATIFGGYKSGQGDFASWDGGLETKTRGEYSIGFRLPLLAGRSIDSRRIATWQARISQEQAQPIVLEKKLEVTRKAASAYWKWVAAGQKLKIAKKLLDLAVNRRKTVALAVQEGQLARIALTENKRQMIERESIVTRSERVLEQSAIALSLYWRDENGEPQIPQSQTLPQILPTPINPTKILRKDDVQLALSKRPEIKIYELKKRSLELKSQLAKNDLLPNLSLSAELAKDVGNAVSSPDNKGPTEARIFLQLDIPLQRKKARGKVRMINAKKSQLIMKQKFAKEKVIASVIDAASNLRQTWLQIDQARQNKHLAQEIEIAERLRLSEGQSDLLRVNLREQKSAYAAAELVEITTKYFHALANYRTSLGLLYDETQ